ncbi:MAG: SDR family NAD(P)-dependent oxidoreductase [Hymenobacter sp.]
MATSPAAAPSAQPTILLTGATGNIGSELTKLLIAQNVPFRTMVRDRAEQSASPGRAAGRRNRGRRLQPARYRRGGAGRHRAGISAHQLVRSRPSSSSLISWARRGRRACHLVKQSQWAARADSPVRFLRYHAVVEAAIRASGLTYTFLRPNLFMQGLPGLRIPSSTRASSSPPSARLKSAPWTCATLPAAAAALTQPGHDNKIYDLTGPEALTHAQMAAEFVQSQTAPSPS